jgi:hypothetical protein
VVLFPSEILVANNYHHNIIILILEIKQERRGKRKEFIILANKLLHSLCSAAAAVPVCGFVPFIL